MNQHFFLSTWNLYLRETMFVKVTLRDAKEDVDKVCIEVKKLLTTQVEHVHAISHFNTKHLVLWTTPETLEPQWKNRLKELGIRSGLHSQKVELSRVKYFHAFVSSLNCLSHRCKQWQEKMRDRIENFWPVWRGSQWGGGFYGYRLKFWLIYGYRLIFFSYG